ncbi:hypothetical protein [Fibrobacter sp.]|uniref:hypothetical protein n=1 Tax=Fibrobacter sp. TaxID=35828 RepID=UPI00389027E4
MNITYTEKWQYLPWVGTHKDPPEKGQEPDPKNDLSTKKMANNSSPKYRNEFYVGVKAFTFNELVDALRKGHSIKRIGPIGITNGTRFLIIDIDNDKNECITPEQLDHFCKGRHHIAWTKGGSGRDYRYHIIVFLDHPIYTSSEAEAETKAILKELAEDIGRDIEIKPDENQYQMLQWCYGVPQDRMERREIEGTELWCRQITKNNSYNIVPADQADNLPKQKRDKTEVKEKPKLMPYTTAMLANMLYDKQLYAKKYEDGSYVRPIVFLEGTRFDCYEPRTAKKYVPKGKRYDAAHAFIMRIVPQYHRCKSFGLSYSERDVIFTFKTLCMRNFVDAKSWWDETGKSMVSGLTSELHSNEGLKYTDIEAKYKPSHATTLYKRRGFGMATAMHILDNYASVSTDDGTATFPSSSFLRDILTQHLSSYKTFMGYMKMLCIKVIYEEDGRFSHKYDYVWNAVKNCGNQFFYCTRNEGVKSFCWNHGIAYVSLRDVYSGTPKEYKNILKVAQEAQKHMWKWFERLEDPNYVAPPKKSTEDNESDEDFELPFNIETTPWDLADDLPVFL